MDKHDGDQGIAQARDCADAATDKTGAPSAPEGAPAGASAKIEAPEPAPSIAPAAPGFLATTTAAINTALFNRSRARARRLMALAATIAVAAALGAMAGSLATAELGLRGSAGASAPIAAADASPLRERVASMDVQLAALRAAVDTSGRAANAQLTKLGDRFDRLERAQAEPAARLAKLADAVDRIERGASAADRDTTGSIGGTASAATPARPAVPPVIEGWTVRRVYNGAALIQGRIGLVEVLPGDSLPGIGRIETIKRQDGRWVVLTSRGMIVAR